MKVKKNVKKRKQRKFEHFVTYCQSFVCLVMQVQAKAVCAFKD